LSIYSFIIFAGSVIIIPLETSEDLKKQLKEYVEARKTNAISYKTTEEQKLFMKLMDTKYSEFQEFKKLNNELSDPDQGLLFDLSKAGQVYKEGDKYFLYKKSPKFLKWCVENGYIFTDKENEDYVTAEFVHNNIETGCTLQTLQDYIKKIKRGKNNTRKGQQRP